MSPRCFALVTLSALACAAPLAANISLATEFNTHTVAYSSSPTNLLTQDDQVYFFIMDKAGLTRLCVSDGSNARDLAAISDLTAGAPSSLDRVYFDGSLYFQGSAAASGRELWRFEIATESTTLVHDLNPGAANSDPVNMRVFDGKLYFQAEGGQGRRLYVWDSSAVSEVAAASALDLTGKGMIVYQNALYFAAADDTAGYELWRFDGTSAEMVDDINQGAGDSFPQNLTEYGGDLYCKAYTESTGWELWRYTGSGFISLATDIQPDGGSSDPDNLAVYDGKLYFSANDGTNGNELWSYDGTAAALVADIVPGTTNSNPAGFAEFEGDLYFSAGDDTTLLKERFLWRYDGTSVTQVELDDASVCASERPHIAVLPGMMIYSGYHFATGCELWRYTAAGGAEIIGDLVPGTFGVESKPGEAWSFGGALYYSSGNGDDGLELFRFDGTNAVMLPETQPGMRGSGSFPIGYINDLLYFTGESDPLGFELYTWDGNTISLVQDLLPGSEGAIPSRLGSLGSTLIFGADDGISGREVWKLDAAGSGQPELVMDIRAGAGHSNPDWMEVAPAGGFIFFGADDGVNGRELWRSDGMTTEMVGDIMAGPEGSSPEEATTVGSAFYFMADDGGGDGIWRYDASRSPALKRMIPGAGHRNVVYAGVWGDEVWFTANEEGVAVQLWRVNDATEATSQEQILDGSVVYVGNPKVIDGALIFSATASESGRELWHYDPATDSEASLLADIYPGATGSQPAYMEEIDGKLYFQADDGVNGPELWRYDGSVVALLRDIRQGPKGSDARYFKALGESIYFSADDGLVGDELWGARFINAANSAPAFTGVADASIYRGETLQLTISASDADGDVLTYSLDPESRALGFRIDPQSGELTRDDDYTRRGAFRLTLTVSDGLEVRSQTMWVHLGISRKGGGTCSLGQSGNGGAIWWMLLLGLVVLCRRRRIERESRLS